MGSLCSISRFEGTRPLSSLEPGATGVVVKIAGDNVARAERLAALGVTPGARIRVLQTFPGFVFQCDETELAVERRVARQILVEIGGDESGTELATSS